MADFPMPTLRYRFNGRFGWQDGEGIHGEGSQLAHVGEVTAYVMGGEFVVNATGRMLCKDGHVGPSRSRRVDHVRRGQPDWLDAIIKDARMRLDPPRTARTVEMS